jgi:glutathione synthase
MKLGIIMDPITGIKIEKDSSFAILLAAQARGWEIYYMEAQDLFLADTSPGARMRRLNVNDDKDRWYNFIGEKVSGLSALDVILMRKDPPVDMEYIYTTHILELAQKQGVIVVNDPSALRDFNEKLLISWFPDCIPPTLVTKNEAQIISFAEEHGDIILKPLHGMGGLSVFRARDSDPNLHAIIEHLTSNGTRFAMAQRFLPEIVEGDKRILLINGEPVPYALARIPKPGDHRGNLAVGGTGKGVELTARDREICAKLAPVLNDKGLLFVGIDVIGVYLTEINITSPTCIRELDKLYDLDIAGDLILSIQKKCNSP